MTSNKSGKRGIALVVVLGMLALLVMIGVAFSVFMRTERQAAGSFQHDVRGRVLLDAAKVRALEALENNLTNVYPSWTFLPSPGGGIRLTPNDLWVTNVPDVLLDTFPGGAGWIDVPNGRVGYLIFNASGLVDANTAGGAGVVRGLGVDPKEITLSSLPEVTASATLIANRTYESVYEMKRAGVGIGLSGVKNLVTFSMSPTNVLPVPIDMGALVDAAAVNAKMVEIKAALTAMAGLTPAQATIAFNALLDYVDADSTPMSLTAPCMERVPMINEIRCRPFITGPVLMFEFQVELFYPFAAPVKPNPKSYTLNYKYTISLAPGAPAGFPVPPPVLGTVKLLNFTGAAAQPFKVLTIAPGPILVDPAFVGTSAKFDVNIEYLDLVDDSTAATVDQVKAPFPFLMGNDNFRPAVTVPAVLPVLAPVFGTAGGAECVDPRFNHQIGCWLSYWLVGQVTAGNPAAIANGTMNSMNAYATFQLNKTTTDGHPGMYVADGAMKSAGEWSYIIRGNSGSSADDTWKTFRLLDEGTKKADPIYTYFTVKPATATQRGFVNPNTEVPEVMEAVFKDMALDSYPEEPGAHKVTDAEAATLAAAWVNDPTCIAGYASKTAMISNTAYLTALNGMVSALPFKEFRKEAGIRNLIGLLNPRQNYFIIVLFAQSSAIIQLPRNGDIPGAFTNTVRSDQTGILELWRDPIAPTHPMFIRRFDILNQE